MVLKISKALLGLPKHNFQHSLIINTLRNLAFATHIYPFIIGGIVRTASKESPAEVGLFFCAQTTLVVFCRDLPAEAVYPEIISIFVYAKTGDIIIGPVPCTGLGN